MDGFRRLEDHDPASPTLSHPGIRLRLLSAIHRWVRFGPWLVVAGAVLTVWGLTSSVERGAAGALVIGTGVAASMWQPRIRRRTSRRDHPDRVTSRRRQRRHPRTRRTR